MFKTGEGIEYLNNAAGSPDFSKELTVENWALNVAIYMKYSFHTVTLHSYKDEQDRDFPKAELGNWLIGCKKILF